jgi:sugar-specific transcriptional regulator TrmB
MWAKHAKVNRSSMYVLLERLKSQGLITTFTHHNLLYVQAVPIKELPAILSDRQQSLELTRDLLLKNLPELQKLEKTHGLTPKVTFYEGISKVEAMYEHAMNEKSFKSYFHPGRIKTLMPEYFHMFRWLFEQTKEKQRS